MAVAVSVTPEGTVAELEMPAAGVLAFTRKAIGCRYVDVVRLTGVLDMWLDDEGMFGQPVNPVATALARMYGYVRQPYFGTVVLCSATERGESVGLTAGQAVGLVTRLRAIAEEM
jgi:hypothetical protein